MTFNDSEKDKLDLLFKKTLGFNFTNSGLSVAQQDLTNYYINNSLIFSDPIPEREEVLITASTLFDSITGLSYEPVTTPGFTHIRKYTEITLKNVPNTIREDTGGSWEGNNVEQKELLTRFIYNVQGNMSPTILISNIDIIDISINIEDPDYKPIVNAGIIIFTGNSENNKITEDTTTIKLKDFFIYDGSFGLNNIPIDGSYVLEASLNDWCFDLKVLDVDICHNLNVNGKTSLKQLTATDVSFSNLDVSNLLQLRNDFSFTYISDLSDSSYNVLNLKQLNEWYITKDPNGNGDGIPIDGSYVLEASLNDYSFDLKVLDINCGDINTYSIDTNNYSINCGPINCSSTITATTSNANEVNISNNSTFTRDNYIFSGLVNIVNRTQTSIDRGIVKNGNSWTVFSWIPYVHRCITLSIGNNVSTFDGNTSVSYIPRWNFDINGFLNNNGFGMDNHSGEAKYDLYITYSDFLGGGSSGSKREFISGVFIQSKDSTNNLNFTGQHRCFLEKYISSKKLYIGLIVNSSGKFININSSLKPNINEALPICKLCSKDNAKNVFGVISNKEDEKREYFTGNIGHNGSKIFNNEYRFMINSLGEGGIWVSNKNGILENGDYISSSSVDGYGQKQLLNEGILCNFTVAKITCDCNFNLNKVKKQKILTKDVEFFDNSNNKYIEKQIDFYDDDYNLQFEDDLDTSGNPIYEYTYDTRFLDSSANILSGEEEYLTRLNNGENVYIACFVGCTYHCG